MKAPMKCLIRKMHPYYLDNEAWKRILRPIEYAPMMKARTKLRSRLSIPVNRVIGVGLILGNRLSDTVKIDLWDQE